MMECAGNCWMRFCFKPMLIGIEILMKFVLQIFQENKSNDALQNFYLQ